MSARRDTLEATPARSSIVDARVRVSRIGYRALVRPVLFRLGRGDAETAHETTVRVLGRVAATGVARRALAAWCGHSDTVIELAGLRFAGPVGIAAGLDKAAVATKAWSALGASHVELGTVTAHPQPGNDRPRMFRLPTSGAVINRMGFNNPGAAAVADRLRRDGIRRGNGAAGAVVGVSIGKSKITPLDDAVADYLTSLRLVAPFADYVAVNVSSPNTPGLRSLQDAGQLRELITELVHVAGDLPILVKLAPDLAAEATAEAVDVATAAGAAGLIATNTTLSRDGICAIDRRRAAETGGLSGRPLTARAVDYVRRLHALTDLPIIGVGGIMTAADAMRMLDAGARLVQVYTGLVYAGPGLIGEINRRDGSTTRQESS